MLRSNHVQLFLRLLERAELCNVISVDTTSGICDRWSNSTKQHLTSAARSPSVRKPERFNRATKQQARVLHQATTNDRKQRTQASIMVKVERLLTELSRDFRLRGSRLAPQRECTVIETVNSSRSKGSECFNRRRAFESSPSFLFLLLVDQGLVLTEPC